MFSKASRTTLPSVFPEEYCPKLIKTTLHRIFCVQCYLQLLGQHCVRFLSVQVCPKSITTTLNRIFPVQCCLSGQRHTRFSPLQYAPKCIKTTLNKLFPVQCCMEVHGQHGRKLLPVQCWTMVNRQLFRVKELIQYYVYQAEATLHMNIVYSMLFSNMKR